MTDQNDYIQTAEAAALLGVSRNTLRIWADEGKIPVHRHPANGYRYFQRSDLKLFLRKAPVPAKPAQGKKRK